MRFDSLAGWLAYQESLNVKTIELGLERVKAVYDRLGLAPRWKAVITVAGTNGKGSCVAMLTSILSQGGYRVGSYTSPHLIRYNERVSINGVPVDDARLCAAFEQVEEARGDVPLTYFEFGTLAALVIFASEPLDAVILEVGLGGRLDAVNIIDPDVALIAALAIDHTEWLGPDRESIAREKAGIMRAGKPMVCIDPDPPQSLRAAVRELDAKGYFITQEFNCESLGASLWRWRYDEQEGPACISHQESTAAADASDLTGCSPSRRLDVVSATPAPSSSPSTPSDRRLDALATIPGEKCRLELPYPALVGDYQLRNAAGVIMSLWLLKDRLPLTHSSIAQGLQRTFIPGRFQIVAGSVTRIFDVAHNEQAARALAGNLKALECHGKTHAVVSMLKDKAIADVARVMRPVVDQWYAGGLAVPRAADVDYLAGQIRQGAALSAGSVAVFEDVVGAYEAACRDAAPGDRIVVFGSFFTVGAVLPLAEAMRV